MSFCDKPRAPIQPPESLLCSDGGGAVVDAESEVVDDDDGAIGVDMGDEGVEVELGGNVVVVATLDVDVDVGAAVQSTISVTVIAPAIAPSDEIDPAAPGAQMSVSGGTISQEFPFSSEIPCLDVNLCPHLYLCPQASME